MKENKWLYLIVLALVWGSSFILMKKALLGLTPIQIGALRILIAIPVLILLGHKKIRAIEKKHWKPIAWTAFLGTFFPAFFFAFAINEIDSSISAVLSSLTPLITMLLGVAFFQFAFRKKQIFGILIGLLGTLLLINKGMELNPHQNYYYISLVFLSSIGYALSMNIVKTQLEEVDALAITAGGFLLLLIPASVVFGISVSVEKIEWNTAAIHSLGYIALLSVFGTTIAKVLFNRLVQISSPVFSSSVTYLITVVAVFWGVLDGEKLTLHQLGAIFIIFLGVYLVNKKRAT